MRMRHYSVRAKTARKMVMTAAAMMMMMGLEKWLDAVAKKAEYVRRGTGPVVDRTTAAISESGDGDSSGDERRNLVKLAKAHYGILDAGFHVAVVGARACGKSSLINGLRHVHSSDQDAAPVGTANTEPEPYRASLLAGLLVLWEFPGAGIGHPELTYYYDKKLYAFDLILIVSDRFRKLDFEVARAALRHKAHQRFFFVKTKADLSLTRILHRQAASNDLAQAAGDDDLNNNAGFEASGNNRSLQDVVDAMKALRVQVDASFKAGLRLSGIAPPSANPFPLFIVSSPAFLEPHVYLSQNSEIYEDDEECKLDEDALHINLTNFVRNLIRRSKTLKHRAAPTPQIGP